MPDCYLCLTPPEFDLTQGALPARQNGYITFGSFNNLSKINENVIDTWSNILKSVPSSRLTLKTHGFSDLKVRNRTLNKFQMRGIDSNRLILLDPVDSRVEHFEQYQKIDIALDTFPYPGVTTSAEALWMGVPVINLKGNSFLSSTATSIAINAGLGDWVAVDIEDYINKAIKFSSNIDNLTKLRAILRTQVFQSPLFNTNLFAKNFGDSLLNIWTQKLAQLNSENLE